MIHEADKPEHDAMETYLAETPCPLCGGEVKLYGGVYYTCPLRWGCKCTQCQELGLVFYNGIPIRDLPPDKAEEAKRILGEPIPPLWNYEPARWEAYKAFDKEHGFYRPREIRLEMR